MRAFKNKWFNKWAREEGIPDSTLWQAAQEVVDGHVEAALGKYLYKKRIPRAGTGKSSGYRAIVMYKKLNIDRLFFLYAFAKNERSSISDKEEAVLHKTFNSYVTADDNLIKRLIEYGTLHEITGDSREQTS